MAPGQTAGFARGKNTDGLIGAVAKVLATKALNWPDSTLLLKDLLAPEGVLTRRKPSDDEKRDIDYGRRIAALFRNTTSVKA